MHWFYSHGCFSSLPLKAPEMLLISRHEIWQIFSNLFLLFKCAEDRQKIRKPETLPWGQNKNKRRPNLEKRIFSWNIHLYVNIISIIALRNKFMDFRYSGKNNCNVLVNDLPKCNLQTSKCLGDFSENVMPSMPSLKSLYQKETDSIIRLDDY